MNKIYKVIYNKNKHRYEVVSELAKSHGGKCKTTVATTGDTNWLRRLWMRVRGGVNKSDEDGNPVTMSISRAAMVALMCISVWSAAAVSSSWVEGASVEGEPVSVKYDEATGTIKIIKTDPNTSDETILATYAVGGNISPITSIGTKNPTGIIAIGDQSKAVQSNTIAIGTDAHAGNVGGSDDTNGRIAIGTKTVASGDRSIALGNYSGTNSGSYTIVQGKDSIGIGTSTSVFGYSGVSIGRRNIIGVPDPGSVKDGVLTTKSKTKYSEPDPGGNSVIVGAYNVAYGNRSNVIGTYSRAMGSNSVAIGSGVQSLSDGSIAIGKGSGYEFEDGSRKGRREKEFYGRDWELPPEYKVLKQVLSTDIAGDKQYEKKGSTWENGGTLPKYNNYGAGSSDPGGFIVEGKNALGIGTYTQVRGDSAIGLATGEMTADLSDKDKSAYARDMRKIMDMEETLYDAKEALQAGTGDTETLKSAVKAAEESLATAKKNFRETYLKKYSFVDGDGALGVGRQILAQGDRSMAVGDYAKAISSDAIAYGGQTLANGTNSMAMGGSAHVGTTDTSFDNSMAIGSHTNVQAGNAVALGAFSEVTGTNSLALGFGTQSSTDSNNITYNSVSGHDSTLIGSYGNIAGNNSILIGSSGSIANDRVVGLGNNINIEAADQNDQENNTAGSVFLGDHAGYVKDSKRSRSLGQVDVVGSAGKMELTESLSSTKGALRDYTKDFIYIYMLERQDDGTQIGAPIAVRSDFAGGDSTVGVVSVGSTYQQQFNSLQDIKDYHSKVGSLITVPVDVTVQVTKNGVPLGEQQQIRYFAADSTRDTIYADNTLSEEDKAKVWDTIQKSISSSNSTYTVFETRRIQNVAPGLIGLNSTDAINGSQLFATNQMLGNLVGSLKKTLGDSVTVTEEGQIAINGDVQTLGWIAKADTVDGSNGTVAYDVDKEKGETEEAYQARIAKLKKDGYIVDASKVMTFKAGKNIGLVQKPGEFSISTIDTPSFKSVELRGETKNVDGNKVTPVTMLDSSGMQVYTETVTPDGDGTTTTKKVSTTVNNEGVTTEGTVKVTNGKDGDKDLVSLGKGKSTTGETDQDFGTIHVDGKQGADGTITIDRGTKSLTDTANVGTDREQEIGVNNPVAGMDRITYTTKGPNDSTINHEVATLDDGFFLTTSKDVTDKKAPAGVKLNNTIKFTDGANTKVSTVTSEKGVHELHIDVSGLPVSYTDNDGDAVTKIGDKYYKSNQVVDGKPIDGATEVPADQVTNNIKLVNTDGTTNALGTISNVASGIGGEVKDAAHDNANTFLENVNKIGKKDGDRPAADAISENVVVNAKDLKNLVDTGFKLNTSGQPADLGASTVKIGETINVINGVNTKVSAIDDTVNGTHTFHIDVTGMPISYTDGEGNALTKIGDDYYKNTDIEDGKPKDNAVAVPADKVTNNVKVVNKDGGTTEQGSIGNVKSVFDSTIGNGGDTGSQIDGINDANKVEKVPGTNQFIKDLTTLKGDTPADKEKLNSVSTVGDLQKVALTPLFFEGDTADGKTGTDGKPHKNTFGRKLSETAKIIGGQTDVTKLTDGNIGVVSNGSDTLTIKLAKELKDLDSVKVSNGKDGDDAKDLVTIGKEVNSDAAPGTDGENGTIGLDGKNGSEAVITIDRGTKSMNDKVNLGTNPSQDISDTNTAANMDRITYTTKGPNNSTINHEVATLDDGFFLTTSKDVANKKAAAGVKLNDTIQFNDGTNTKVSTITSENGVHELHIDVSGLPMSYTDNDGDAVTKIGDKYYKSNQVVDGKPIDGATEVPADQVTNNIKLVNTDGTTNAPGTISNVASGIGGKVVDSDHNDSNTFLENVNKIGAPTNGISENIVVNAKDLKNLVDTGFKLNTSGQPTKPGASTVKIGETINVINGVNTKVSAIDDTVEGTHTFHIDVTGMPISYTDNQGNALTKIGDNYYKNTDITNGVPKPGVSPVDPSTVTDNIKVINKDGSTTNPGTISNVKSAIDGVVGNGAPSGSTINGEGGTNTFIDNVNRIGADTNGIDKNSVVTTGDLKNLADTSLFFSGDAADGKNGNVKNTFGRKLSEEAKIVGGVTTPANLTDNNIGVVSNGSDTLTIKLAKQLTGLDSATYTSPTTKTDDGEATSTMKVDGNGIRFVDDKDTVKTDAPSLTTDGIDGGNKQITNIGSGLKNGDTTISISDLKDPNKVPSTSPVLNNAVNVGDLKNIIDTGFKLNTSGQPTKPGASTVKIGDTINIIDGANTKVSAIDDSTTGTHTFHIDVNGLPMSYVDSDGNPLTKIGDKFYKTSDLVNGVPPAGTAEVPANKVTSNVSMLDNTGSHTGVAPQIKNVGSGLVDNNGETIKPNELLNMADANNPVLKNAVNVGDLKQVAAAAKTEVTGTGKAIVTQTEGDDGHATYNVHVDPVVDVVAADGKTPVVRGDDGKYYNPTDIADKTFVSDGKGGGSWYNKSDIGPNGKPNTDAPVQKISSVDVKNNFVNPNGTGSIVLDNVKSGIGGEVKDADGNNTFIDNINKVGKKNDDGTVAPDALSENTVVNAKDLKNVVDTGFKLNTSGQGTNPADTVKIGDTIQVVDGKNTTVSAITHPTTGVHEFHIDVTGLPVTYTAKEGENGQPVDVSKVGDTYQLADGTKLVKYGDKFYKPNQIVNGQPVGDAQGFTINDDIRLVNPNNGTGPVKITNVAPGVGDNDAVNMSQLKTLSAGSKTEVTGTGAAEVTKKTAKDGHDIYNVHVDKLLTVKPVTPGTPMERGADGKYYAPSEIQDKTFVSDGNGGGSWYAKDDVDKYGTPLDGKSPLAEQPTALDPNTLKTSVTNPNGNGPTIVDNVKSVLDGSGIGNGADMSSTIDAIENGKRVDKAGSNQFIKDLTGLDPDTDANKLNSVSTVSDLQKVALTPLFFEGDTAKDATTNNAFGRKLSEKAKILGGQKDVTKLTDNNIGVVSNGSDTLTIKLAKELQDLTSVTTIDETNGTKTIVSGKGVTTDGKVVVNNGKTGDEAKEFVTIDKGTDGSGTDKEYGKIGLDGKNGSNATITIDRGTKSLNDDVNIGVDPSQPVSETNKSATMDRITYTTTGPNNTVINHEVATLDDGFFLTTSKDVTDNKAAAKVKLNNTIKFTDGANTKVSTVDSKDGIHELHVDVTGLPVTYTASELDDNGKPTNTQNVSKVGDTYQLEDGTKLVKIDDKYYTPDQLDNGTPKPGVKGLTIDNSIRVINPEQPNSTAKITNVAPGEADTDAVNMSQLKQKVAAATTEVTGTGAAEVTKVTGADGQNIYNVHVDKLMTVKPVDANTNIARGGDGKYYNADDIAGKTFVPSENKWYNTADVDENTGKPLKGKTPLDNQPTAVDQNTLKNSVVNPNGNGPTVLDNVKSGIGGDAGNGIKNGSTIDGTNGNNTFIEKLDKVGKPANEGGIDKTTVVNAGDLKNLADTPLFFSGDSADGEVAADGTDKNTFSRKLSQETKIVGGVELGVADTATATERKEAIAAKLTDGNIGVISDGTDTLTIKLAKNLQDLDAVKVSNGKDGKEGKDLVTIGKEVDTKAPAGKDGENGIIGLDGKNGSEAVITIDRGTKSITDEANVGEDPSQPVSGTNKSANMDRITYTTKGANGDINHEVATLDDGFMLTTSTDVANSKAPANVKLNNTIKFTDGANTKVSTVDSKDGVHELHIDVTGLPVTYTATKTDAQGNVVGDPVNVSKVGDTYQDAAGNKLIKVGDKYYRPDQLVDSNVPNPEVKDAEKANGLTITDSISLVNNNGKTIPTTLKNVGSGLKDANGNPTSIDKAVGSNTVNVDDLRTIGKAATTEVTGTGAAEVTKVKGADGQNIYNVHVDKLMTVKPVDANTDIVRGGDGKYYDANDIAGKTFVSDGHGGGNWYDANDVDQTTGKPKTEDDGITPKQPLADQPQAVDQNMLKNSVVNPNGDGPTVLDNVKSGIGGKVVDPEHEDKNTFMEKVDTIGKANGISENTVVNAGDLKNLVDTGFKLNTSGHNGDAQTVKIGETIKVVDGANTKVSDITSKDGVHEFHIDVTGLPMTYTVSQTGDAGTSESVSKVGDTYQLEDGTKLVKVGDKFYKPSQLVDPKADQPQVRPEEVNKNWTVNDSISLVNKEGSKNAPTLKNVGSGLKDANGNPTSIDKAVGSNAVNVDDLRTIGKAATTEVTGTGAAEVTKVKGADGQNIYNVHVDKLMTVKPVDANTDIARGGDGKYYDAKDIAGKTFVSDGHGGGNWYDANDVDQTTGKPKTEDDGITPKQPLKDQPQKVDQNKLKNSVVNPNGDGPTVLDNVKSGIGGEVKDPAHNNKNTFIDNINKVVKKSDDGTVAPGAISEDTVVNAKDLKNVVDTGFKLNTSGHSGDAQTVKIGETIKVVDGANTKVSDITSKDGVHEFHIDVTGLPMTYTVSQTGGTDAPVSVSKVGDTYQLADGTKLVKVGDKFYKPSQLVDPKADQPQVRPEEVDKNWTVNDSISLVNKDGSNNDPNNVPTLKNVGSGLKDAAGNATSIDQAVGTNAVNVDDLRTMGKAATTEVTGSGAAEVTKTTGADGQNIYNVHVDKLMEAKSTEPGKPIVRGSDNKYYYVDDALKQANDGKWYPADQVGTDGKPADGAVGKDTTELTVVPADKLKNSLVNPNGDGPTVLDNVKSGIGGEVKDADGNNTFIDNVNKVGKTNPDGSLANDAISENTVVNAKDLKNVVDTGFKLNTSGHTGDAQTVKIGETIKVVDGANTKVSDITSKDGVHEFHIDVTGLPVTYTATKTDAKGTPTGEPVDVSKVGDGYQLADGTKLVKVGDKYYTPDQLKNGQPKSGAEGLTIKESVSLTQDNSAPATLERVGSGRRDGMKADADPMAWDKILNPSAADKAKVDNMLTNAANIGDVRDAIKSITDGTSDNASGGFGLTGNNGDVKQDLGKTITVKGGIANKVDKAGQDLHVPEKSTTDQNTYVNVKDVPNADGNGTHKEMVVEIAKDLTDLDSVTVGNVDKNGNGGTVINKDGMTVKDATGNNSTSIGTGTIGTSKTDKDGNTSSTNIDGGTITSEKKDKDGNKQSTTIDGSHMTLENKDKDGKLTGPKTEVSNEGMTITPVDKDGNAVTDPKKQVSITDKGLNNGGNQIINVDSGLKDTNGSVKLKDATGDMLNNAVNVGDLKEAINNAQTAVDGDGAAEISKSVDDNGRPTYKVHVDKLVEAKADDGKAIVRGEDNKFYYKDESLKQGTDGKWYPQDKLDTDGNPEAGAVGKNIPILGTDPVPADNLKTSLVNPNDPNSKVKLDNIKSAIGGDVGNGAGSEDKVNGADGTNSFIDNLDKVGKEGGIGNDAAVTTGDLKNLADTPLFFGGDSADGESTDGKEHTNTFDRKLGKQINIKGEVDLGLGNNATAEERKTAIKEKLSDGNIGVISNGKDTVTVKLSKDLKDLNTIEVNDSVSVGKDGDGTVIKGAETTSSFTEVATGPDGKPLYEVDEKGEVVRDSNGDPVPVTKTSSTTTKGGTVTIKDSNVATGPDGKPLYKVDENGKPVLDEKGHKIPITESSSTTTKGGITESVVEKAEVDGDKPLIDENGNPIMSKSTTTTGGGKLATDVEKVKMVDGKPVTSHETTTIDGSHFESKDKDGNYTTINGGEIKSYDKDTNGSVTIKGDSLTASSKDENGHDKVTNISSDGFNSTATTFERDGNGQIVRDPDTGLPKEVTNSTNINSDGFTATRTDSEGNEVLKTTMQNGNIAIEKPQPIIDPTTGEAYKVLDKDGNWVPAHGYTKISDNGFEIQGINQSGTGISKVKLSSEGLDNGGNRITHVAEGIAPDDAVNVSQLRGLTQNINNDIANVGANAAALAGLKAIQYDPLEPTQIMAAVGTYRGKQAAALGIAHYKNEDTMFHMGVSIGSDHTMANIGVTYKFGRTDEKKAVPDRYKAGPISSTYVLQDEMVALKEENARMRANDEKMNAAYDEILNLVKQLKQDNEEMKKKLEKLEKK